MLESLKQHKNKALLLTLLIGNILAWSFYFSLPDGQLHLKIYDVGQGDAIFLRSAGGYTALVDGGPDSSVLAELGKDTPFYSKKIDLVVLTHPDADHLAGLVDVVKQYEVGQVWVNGDKKDTKVYQDWVKTLRDLNLKVRVVKAGDKLKIGSKFILNVIWPPKNLASTKTNFKGIVIKISYGTFDALLTADADKNVQPYTSNLGPVEVLKVPHHGSKEALSQSFLNSISPQVSIISVGAKNTYGHPNQVALEMLGKIGTKIYRTDKDGTIEIVSNGQTWYTETN